MNRYLFVIFALAVITAAAQQPGRSPGTTPISNFGWVLNYEGKSTRSITRDQRTAPLIRSRVPAKASELVLEGLSGPSDNPVLVVGHQFVSISGCVSHYCPALGFFWIDTRRGVGLGAHFDPIAQILTLGSNGLSGRRLPTEAKRALIDWLSEEGLQPARLDDERARP